MKKALRVITLCLAAVLLLGVFTACGKTTRKTTNVKVSIIANGKTLWNEVDVAVVTEEDEDPTVMKAFQQLMDDEDEFPDVEFQLDGEGNPVTVLNIGEYKDTKDKFWEYRLNDTALSDTKGQASAKKVREGDKIYWEYGAKAEDTTAADTTAKK